MYCTIFFCKKRRTAYLFFFLSRVYFHNLLLSPMKKISTGRITVITSPEDSSEFRREGEFDTRSPHSFFCSIRSGEKNRAGGMNPLYFSRNSPEGHIKASAKGRRRGAPLVFFLVPAILKPAVSIFPLGLCLSCSLQPLLYLFSTLFPHTPDPFLSSFSSRSISCSPWPSAGIFSRLLSSPRGILSREFPAPPPSSPSLFRFVLLVYRSFTFPRL